MSAPGQTLEDALYRATGDWSATCKVCGTDMTRGARDHLQSQNHWRKLWNRFDDGRSLPSPENALGLDSSRPWVQCFVSAASGTYSFNHLTGEQAWNALGSSAETIPVESPAQASVARGEPVSDTIWEDGEREHSRETSTVPVQPSASITAHAGHILPSPVNNTPSVGDTALSVVVRTGYQDALNGKAAWRALMEPASARLEKMLHAATGSWGGMCPVCSTEMTRGVADHLPSQNHWKNLWNKLNGQIPPPDAANDWASPWVERFSFAQGPYLFNHVTGEQGYESAVCAQSGGKIATIPPAAAAPPSPAAPPAPPAPPVAAPPTSGVAVVPPRPSQAPAALNAGRTVAGNSVPATPVGISGRPGSPPAFDLSHWLWTRHAMDGARQLQQSLSSGQFCSICASTMGNNVQDHILSLEHFQKLQAPSLVGALPLTGPGDVSLATGPWIQDFDSVSGGGSETIRFNHVCATVECLNGL